MVFENSLGVLATEELDPSLGIGKDPVAKSQPIATMSHRVENGRILDIGPGAFENQRALRGAVSAHDKSYADAEISLLVGGSGIASRARDSRVG